MASSLEKLLRESDQASLSSILPRVIRFAEAAGHTELAHWARLELSGYLTSNPAMDENVVVPEYRGVAGHWCDEWRRPLVIEDPEMASLVNELRIREGVHELETLAEASGTAAIRNPTLSAAIETHLQVRVSLFQFQPAALRQVTANIRGQLVQRLLSIRDADPALPSTSRAAIASDAPADEIIELRPNFMGLGLNLRALWRRWRVRGRE